MVDDPHDAAQMAEIAQRLGDAIEAAFVPWVEATVADRHPAAASRAGELGAGLAERVLPGLRRLLATDIDEQRTTPLEVLRVAGVAIREFLVASGAPAEALAADIGPATWADLGPGVAVAGLEWGAAKAHLHLARRRS